MKLGNLSIVANIASDKEPEVPMETDNPATVSKDTVSGTSQLDQSGVKTSDDVEKSMTNEVIDTLQLDCNSVKDRLSNEDMHKYTDVERFNPKSFQSGSSIGFINLNTVTDELLFAQIRMLRELMFDVIPLNRYDHLVRNGGSKVWSKWTAWTVEEAYGMPHVKTWLYRMLLSDHKFD